MAVIDREKLLVSLELEAATRRNSRRLADYKPYPKQLEFHHADARERLLMAGNQLGKTLAASMEQGMHATGLYPEWWQGRRYSHPTIIWAGGVTGLSTRDNPQRMLMGRPGEFGTGSVPKDRILETRVSAHGVADSLDHVKIAHVSGGQSIIYFKSYEQGREKWQGETVHEVWFDEEPPIDVYVEGLTRTNTTGGGTMMTFTPLLGFSEVVERFLREKPPGTHVTKMTIRDVDHYTPLQIEQITAAYPAHERQARANGDPVLGSGAIFPVDAESLYDDITELSRHWPRICGLDFGWDHPTACVWIAHDRDADCMHVYDTYRAKEETPAVHSAAIRARGDWIPVAWPHDGLQHDKGSGMQLAAQYKALGVRTTEEKATFEDGSNGVEAGVMEMLDRMRTGRLKVAKHLADWFDEFKLYHRKDGQVVKKRDDLLSATRYGMMMLRHARADHKKKSFKFSRKYIV